VQGLHATCTAATRCKGLVDSSGEVVRFWQLLCGSWLAESLKPVTSFNGKVLFINEAVSGVF
jgi:hypothetical protein